MYIPLTDCDIHLTPCSVAHPLHHTIGLTLRTIASFFTMMGFGYTWKERLFYAIAWTPKATVQASLSAVALTFAQNLPDSDPNKPEWLRWGADILTTGVFAIIICASFGTLLVFVMAPILLEKQVWWVSPKVTALVGVLRLFGRCCQVPGQYIDCQPHATSLWRSLNFYVQSNLCLWRARWGL